MSVPYPRVAAPADGDEPSDIDLIARVRAGSSEAYGLLYERHLASARNLARQLSRSTADVDDLVAEAFAKVFATLRAGGGPTTAFRAYLLTTKRRGSFCSSCSRAQQVGRRAGQGAGAGTRQALAGGRHARRRAPVASGSLRRDRRAGAQRWRRRRR